MRPRMWYLDVMPSWLKHTLAVVAGAGMLAAGTFFPPVAPILGPLGTKLALWGAGTTALAMARGIPDLINGVRK